MRIVAVRVQNYRSIRDETFGLGELTALVGPNGCGKSSALRAVKTFYETSPSLTVDDYYNRDETLPVKIAITFVDMTTEENGLFAPYTHNNALTVTKIITTAGEKYHGSRKSHPGFKSIRGMSNKTERRSTYNDLRVNEQYADLPAARNAEQVDEGLLAWETAHPDKCEMMEDSGQFFGFRNVGQSRLERFTRFVFVPAVREAEQDAADSRGSAIYQLMEMVVRSAIAQNKEFNDFKASVQGRYAELISPAKLTQLRSLSDRLSRGLKVYVPASSVILDWQEAEQLDVPLPKAFVRLEEDGFQAPVDRVGHGLQRAFILSLLQELVGAQSTSEMAHQGDQENAPLEETEEHTLPSLILAIEEPELYQHPNRQRFLARTFQRLSCSGITGVASATQVIYSTHSPLFVDIENFACVRRLTKSISEAGRPKVTKVRSCTLDDVAKELQRAQDTPDQVTFTGPSLKPRMQALMTPWMNEGFFADVVVLVEGETDRAAIIGAASARNLDLESKGVAIIPCGGKDSIDRPLLVFSGLGIPTYVVFDADAGCDRKDQASAARTNRVLQRMFGVANPKDFPETCVSGAYAVFQSDLNTILRHAVGEEIYMTKVWTEFQQDRGYPRLTHAEKAPFFITRVLSVAKNAGIEVKELNAIVDKVLELTGATPTV